MVGGEGLSADEAEKKSYPQMTQMGADEKDDGGGGD